jgi:hypothetical protein
MKKWFEIKCLSEDEQVEILHAIEAAIERKQQDGILKEREVREIIELELKPLLDIQDVQSVYDNHLFREKVIGKARNDHGQAK